MKDVIKSLEDAGFKHDDESKDAHVELADRVNMHESGPYVVHGVWKKGLVTVKIEQNTAAEPMGGGLSAVIQHPPVALVSGPNGTVACNPDDIELALDEVS